MGSHAVRAQLYKHLDVERKVAKQAEARLGQRLQQLEAARLRRLVQLAREQRQLQAQLQRLWEGEGRAGRRDPNTHTGRQGSVCAPPRPSIRSHPAPAAATARPS